MTITNGNGNRRLTGKQRAFVNAYLGEANFNATEAARIAGYDSDDYFVLANIGCENLKKPKISERIEERLRESAMCANEVLTRLAEIARGDHRHYMTTDGTLDIASLVADGKAHLIKSIRPNTHGTVYEFCDMQGALVQLGKHHGLFIDRVQHAGKDGSDLLPVESIVTALLAIRKADE
jgi:phage terminase small subunit